MSYYVASSVNPDGVRAQEIIGSLDQDVLEELGHAKQRDQGRDRGGDRSYRAPPRPTSQLKVSRHPQEAVHRGKLGRRGVGQDV